MPLPDGKYRTEHGSEVVLSKNGGRTICDFDWLEQGACFDCCSGGVAKLTLVEE